MYLNRTKTTHILHMAPSTIILKKTILQNLQINCLSLLFLLQVLLFLMEQKNMIHDTGAFRTVTKLCTSCHGTAFYQAKQIDDDDWYFYFNTPQKLEKLHKYKPEGLTAVMSPLFKKRKKRLLKFFIDNSKFSGAVNGCDANF